MLIGIPKEIMENEKRVAATPETVKKYVNEGWTVLIEHDAGLASFYQDQEYVAAGATIVDNVEEIFEKAEVILKVKEPLFNKKTNKHEIDMMHKGQIIITFIHPASPVNHDMVRHMAEKGIIGLTLDGVPRIPHALNMDPLVSMSICAGYKGMLMAINDLSRFAPEIDSAVGILKPIKALIIGVGVAGRQAIDTARRLGAEVYGADIRPISAENANKLGIKTIDLPVPQELLQAGSSKGLPENVLNDIRAVLKEAIRDMDIVLLSALVPGHIAPILITEDMVNVMKPGSVVVDISIDQGGNCACTVPGKIANHNGVIIQGIKNIPGSIPTSSTWMFAQNVYNLVHYLTKDGKINIDLNDEICSSILVTKDGKIVHEGTLAAMAK